MGTRAIYPSLSGKRVFITGGATGLGAAMVEAFALQDAVVGFIDIALEAANELAQQIVSFGKARPWFREVDVTDSDALQSSISAFAQHGGGLEILVNNVANDSRHDPMEVSYDTWHQCMAVNLDSAFFASQRAAALMRDGGSGGAIINLSSINALLGPKEMPGYVTAKAGLVGMTKALAHDFGPDSIRVNAILPGWIVTDRQLDLWLTEEAEAEWMEQVCLKERILPSDAADLALFLASGDSRMITSQSFIIDGGRI